MTKDELTAIRERADKATPGPWFAWRTIENGPTVQRAAGFVFIVSARGTMDDAEFSAAARTDIPALLAEVERLKALARTMAGNIVRGMIQDGLSNLADEYMAVAERAINGEQGDD